MINKIIISVGLAILIGIVAGYYFEEEKFYSLYPGKDKNEITEKYFDQNVRSNEEYYSKELVFNTEKAALAGFSFLGLFLIFSGLSNKRK